MSKVNFIKKEGSVSFIHFSTAQTAGPRKMKFGVYFISMIYWSAKREFFEIGTLKEGKGPKIGFQSFSRSLKPEKVEIWF